MKKFTTNILLIIGLLLLLILSLIINVGESKKIIVESEENMGYLDTASILDLLLFAIFVILAIYIFKILIKK